MITSLVDQSLSVFWLLPKEKYTAFSQWPIKLFFHRWFPLLFLCIFLEWPSAAVSISLPPA